MHIKKITIDTSSSSDIERALRAVCEPFGSLTWTSKIPELVLTYVGRDMDYAQQALTVEAGIDLLRATRDVDGEWSEVLLGAHRVQLVTPTSRTVIELRRYAGGWTLSVDFGEEGSEHRADQILEHGHDRSDLPALPWEIEQVAGTATIAQPDPAPSGEAMAGGVS